MNDGTHGTTTRGSGDDLLVGAHSSDDSFGERRSRARERATTARRRQRRRRGLLVLLVVALVVAGGAWAVSSVLGGLGGGDATEQAVEDYPGPGRPSAQVVIPPGATGAQMGAVLAEAGVVATAGAFADAFEANPDAPRIASGTYNLLLEMKASTAVEALLNPASRATTRLTIPEGYTVTQVLARTAEVTGLPLEEVQAAAADTAAIGLPAEAGGRLEGWLFPATYDVEPGATATGVLQQMTAQTVAVLQERAVPADRWQTVLTTASLVEREGSRDEDRPKMARAIENRLERGMRLDIDAAVAYGAGKSGSELTTADLEDASNPYNLYLVAGLPPTPIASPGTAAIDAVLSPEEGDWLFWVTVDLETGETLFATTNDEHNANRQLYEQWLAENS